MPDRASIRHLFLAACLLASAFGTPRVAGAVSPLTLTPPPAAVKEGSPARVVARFDPTGIGAPGQFQFDWGDGEETVLPAPPAAPFAVSASHAYADDGAFTLRVRVTVAGHDPVVGVATITVVNAAPVLAPLPDVFAPLGKQFRLSVTFADPGAADTHDVVVEWGDGASDRRQGVVGGVATFLHRYAARGNYSAAVRVDDGEGGQDGATFAVEVGTACGGLPVTIDAASAPPGPILGTAGDDVILGTPEGDVISGLGGDDVICGGGGDDTLNGGPGDDVLLGGPGDDSLNGGYGTDALGGGPGADVLRGGPDGDVLHGGAGADELHGDGGTDFLFRSEYPSRDTMDGGPGENVVDTAKRGTEASGIRRYLTEAEALAFQGSYLLGEFTTYHDCCQDRVVNIQLMADTIHGHVVMPGETFSVNATVGQRTAAKGYLPAGAIIGGYVQCCDYPDNMGGGTSQFGTTIYNAVFFAGLEDIEHQPHSLDFARYPDGREATMGYPHPDVVFRNDTSRPVMITTHHAGHYGTSITVKIWGDNDGRRVTAGASPRRGYYNTSLVVYEGDPSLEPGEEIVKTAAQPGYTIDVFRYIDYPGGDRTTEKWTWTYSAGPEVRKVHPCKVPPGNPDYTGEACPDDGDEGGGGGQLPA